MRAALLLALLTGPVAGDHPSFLTGTWFGQGEPNDRSEMWLAQAGANGEFAVQFRSCRKGKASDLLQKGIWSFQGDTETVQITQSGGMIVFNETPYKILFHDGNHQTYSMPSGFVFKSSRVGAGFHMPPCDLTS
jgi:hypothetical protein